MLERKFAEQGFAGRAANANPAVLAALRAAVRADANPNPRAVTSRPLSMGALYSRLSLPVFDAKKRQANDFDKD